MELLHPEELVWVPADLLQAAGVTEFELPLFRPERGLRSSLMDVCNHRARVAGLCLTDPAVTLRDLRAALSGKEVALSLTRGREMELIRLSREVHDRKGLGPPRA